MMGNEKLEEYIAKEITEIGKVISKNISKYDKKCEKVFIDGFFEGYTYVLEKVNKKLKKILHEDDNAELLAKVFKSKLEKIE